MVAFNRIAIIGVGLIGSSLAMALKKGGFSGTITGIGRRENNLRRAQELGIIDECSTEHQKGIENADLIVLASTVSEFAQIVSKISSSIQRGAIVTDVGSVKSRVVCELELLMPEGVRFVGGHPIAGKECSGIESAAHDLFANANCIITPTPNTDRDALEKIRILWETVGASVVLMNPDEHDAIFGAVSHLPHVVAYALINAIMEYDTTILKYGGKGLKDMTRIALSPAELWRDICFYNKQEILNMLSRFTSSLSRMIQYLEESDAAGLEKEFTKAKEARERIASD